MNSSIEMHSPSPCQINPRKLRFMSPGRDADEDDEMNGKILQNMAGKENNVPLEELAISPPYRKVRALRLFDTPATPKTILEKSSGKCLLNGDPLPANITEEDVLFLKTVDRPRPVHLHHHIIKEQTANVNPFTPDSKLLYAAACIPFSANKDNNKFIL